MLDALERAIESRCEPQSLFDRIICLGWYDGPMDGICSSRGRDFRYEMVDNAGVLRYRVFRLARLPFGSVARFMDGMYRYGQLADGESPPSPMWAPMSRDVFVQRRFRAVGPRERSVERTSLVETSDCAVAGEQVAREQKDAAGGPGLRYWLYLPDGYETTEEWPLLLFLHGGGEGGEDLQLVKKHGPPKQLAAGGSMPMIVVSPQNPSTTQFWDDQALARLLDELQEDLKVDSRRIYLTGLSRGAYGAWRLAIQNPSRFAALVPISGGGAQPYVKRIKKLPTWAFHGAKDRVIPVSESERMVRALKAAGGNVRLTIFPDAGHDAWTQAYDSPELLPWLLEQKRAP